MRNYERAIDHRENMNDSIQSELRVIFFVGSPRARLVTIN